MSEGLDRSGSALLDPVTISWSGLKRWENCPHHQLRTIQGATEKGDKGRIFLPGTICDRVQRRWLDSENPQPGEMVQMVDEVFAENTGEDAEYLIKWKGDKRKDMEGVKAFCRQTVTHLEPWLIEHVLPYDYEPEVRFTAYMEIPYLNDGVRAPLKMIGGIDIVVRDHTGKFRLYDLKVTKDPGYIRSTLGQLTFYDLAWGVIQGSFSHANDWGFICPALPEKYVGVTVDQDDRRAMMARIVKYAQGVWKDEWLPKSDDSGCTWCEARGSCTKFKTIPIVESNGKQRMSFAQAASQRAKFRT